MDFVPQPEEAKKFGTIKWFKWHIYKYPYVWIMVGTTPIHLYLLIDFVYRHKRGLNDGTYVPDVVKNRYAVCRSDDWPAKNTPKRYIN